MRRLAIFFLLCGLAFAGDEIHRPTAEADGGANTALGCLGSNASSTAMPLAWDAAGLITSSDLLVDGGTHLTKYRTRIFKSFAAASVGYSSLTLNVVSSVVFRGSGGAHATVNYSLDSGATWHLLTSPFALSAGQDLTKLQVGYCVEGDADPTDPGGITLTVYDIWTDGKYTSTNTGAGTSTGKRHVTVVF